MRQRNPILHKQKEDYEEILDTAQKNSVTGKVVQEAYGLDPNYRQSQQPRDDAIQPRKPMGEFSAQPVAVGGNVREKAPAKARKKEGGLGWPAIAGICVGVLLLLAVGGVFLLPFVVPPETIKSQISSVLKEKTGRDVSLKGKLSYRFFPSFGVDLNKIIIHNPPNIKGPDFLNLGRLQADLKLLPLLQKRVEVDRIILHRPEFCAYYR